MQTVSQRSFIVCKKKSHASCKSYPPVYVCLTHSLRLCNSSSLETCTMNRLIVIATLATLLGSASGCSMLNRSNAQSCETCDPTPPSSLLSRLRMPSISLPWRRAAELSGDGECNSCNEGFSEVGYAEGGYVDGGVVEGAVYDGGYYDGSISSESLYHPDSVYAGPTVIQSSPSSYSSSPVSYPSSSPISTTTKYAGELLPTPVSPELGTGKN